MPMISGGRRVLAHYPDGAAKLLTLYAEPVVGQVIAHGWKVTAVAVSESDEHDFEITLERPAGAP
jgi:hypothetical protein